MSKNKIYEALLVLSTALLVIYLIGFLRNGESHALFLYLACGIGLTGILFRPLGRWIAWGWYKLADMLSFVMSKVILGIVYMFVLVPIAALSRLGKKDKLHLRRTSKTLWIDRNHRYGAEDLTNVW